MELEPLFKGQDLTLIESLVYNPELLPAYDMIKNCLIWEDERPEGLTSAGYESLCDLWIARSFFHRGLDPSAHALDPQYFKNVWQRALAQGFNWPGFKRMSLSQEDRQYYLQSIEEVKFEV